jgi:hypothetical protein
VNRLDMAEGAADERSADFGELVHLFSAIMRDQDLVTASPRHA